MSERTLVASSWYLPTADEDLDCESLELENNTTDDDECLCPNCADFDLIAALEAPKYAANDHILWLGPFDHAIEHTECPLCRVARQTIGHQDADPDLEIRIKSLEQSALSVDSFRKGEIIGGGYLSCGPFDMNMPLDARKIVYESATQPWLPSVSSIQPSLEWYRTYTASQAQKQCVDWLSVCSGHDHSTCNSRITTENNRQGYFVDAHGMRIVKATSTGDEPYFALSYVCGGVRTVGLSEYNESAVSVAGSLVSCGLPRTYTDAIQFTLSLGARYLWIDTLCIMHDQDGGPDQDQIEAMDRIYGDATLVLVASTGTSPHFGLFPRSVEPRKTHGIFLHIDRRSRVDDNGLDHGNTDVFKTKYATRMWCFQEQRLSTRRVIFGAHWLVFNCNEAEWIVREDGAGRLVPSPSIGSCMQAEAMRLLRAEPSPASERFNNGRRFDAYATLAQSYTKAELSYAADVERAFAGLAAVVSRRQTQAVVHNILMAMLPHALLWTPDSRFTYRARSPSAAFPTWSWAWTTDAISYPVVASLMFSSQQPPSTHLHRSLVSDFWLQTSSASRRIAVSSLVHKSVKSRSSAATGSRDELRRADNRPSALRFYAYAVSTVSFSTKILSPPDPKPEDWDEVTATQELFLRFDNSSRKQPVGIVWGLAEGHGCFAMPESLDPPEGYFLLALLAVDRKRSRRSRAPEIMNFCIVVHLHGGISRRIGMVEVSEGAFNAAKPDLGFWQLV